MHLGANRRKPLFKVFVKTLLRRFLNHAKTETPALHTGEVLRMVIAELHKIQHAHGYIPERELYDLSQRMQIPVYELHGVASFYPGFRLKPPPRVEVLVCGDFP